MPLPDKSLADPAVERNFRSLDQRLGDGQIRTAQLSANAVTQLHIATPSTSAPTTTSTADPMDAVIPQVEVTADFGGDPVVVFFSGSFSNSGAANITRIELYDAGTRVATTIRATDGANPSLHLIHAYTPSSGSRTLDIRWNVSAGTATATLLRRSLIIAQLKK